MWITNAHESKSLGWSVCAVASLGRPIGLSVCAGPGACEQCVNCHAIQNKQEVETPAVRGAKRVEALIDLPKIIFFQSKIIACCNSTAWEGSYLFLDVTMAARPKIDRRAPWLRHFECILMEKVKPEMVIFHHKICSKSPLATNVAETMADSFKRRFHSWKKWIKTAGNYLIRCVWLTLN